jgi:hypothetical protein
MKEAVSFQLSLSCAYTKNPPYFTVLHNDIPITNKLCVKDSTNISFKLDLEIDKFSDHCLKIERSGFDSLNEQLLRLDKITADNIDLHNFFHNSKFYPEYPEPWATEQLEQGKELPLYHKGWVEWGWNGTWVLEFQAPFYTWMLDNV